MKIKFDKAPLSPQHNNGVGVPYGSAKRNVPRWRWYLLLLMVCALPLFLIVRFVSAAIWQSAPAVVVAEYAIVRAGVSGRIDTVAAAGTVVHKGEPLLSLMAPSTTSPGVNSSVDPGQPGNAAAGPAAAALAGADAREAGLRDVVQIAQQQSSLLQARVRQMQTLQQQQAATRQEVTNAEGEWLQAQTALARARDELSQLRQQQLTAAAAARVVIRPAAPSAALPQGTVDLAVRAPFDATVVRPLVLAQEWITPDTEIAVMQGTQAPVVHAYLPPSELRYAEAGRTATLRFFDGGRVTAKVLGVVSEAEQSPALRNASLVPREPSVVVRLQPDQVLPERYRIHQLPLDVRFDRSWRKDGI